MCSTLPIQSRIASLVASFSVFAAAVYLDDVGAHQPHPEHIQILAANVLRAHVDVALEPEKRGRCRSGDAVLTRARFSDQPLLAHPNGKQRLADGVVDFMGAGVIEVLALEIDFRPAEFFREPPRQIKPAGTPDEIAQVVVELAAEAWDLPARCDIPASSCCRAKISVSGTKTPPYAPKCPDASGREGAAGRVDSAVLICCPS